MDLRLDPEVPQGPGGLHQGPPQKGASRQIGRQHQIPGHALGIQLPLPGHHDPGGAAGEPSAPPPEGREHPVIGPAAPRPVQGHGKQQLLPRQSGQTVRLLNCPPDAPGGQKGFQHRPQFAAVGGILRENDNHQLRWTSCSTPTALTMAPDSVRRPCSRLTASMILLRSSVGTTMKISSFSSRRVVMP